MRGRISGRGGFPAVGGSQVRRTPVPLLPTYLSLVRGTTGSSCRMPNPIALGRVLVEGFLSCNTCSTSPFHQHPAPTCSVFFYPARPLPAERFSSYRTLVVTDFTVVIVAFLQQWLLGRPRPFSRIVAGKMSVTFEGMCNESGVVTRVTVAAACDAASRQAASVAGLTARCSG